MNARQTLFVQAYLVDPNAKKAAIAAGYSAKTAEQLGSRLLRNVQVKAAIAKAQAARAARVEVKADDVLRELLLLARVDIGKAFDRKGDLLPIHKMSEDVRRAISGHRPTKYGTDIKFHPKTTALEMLGKHLGLFKNDSPAAVGHSELTVVVQSLAEPKKAKK